jgi:hypothetical protein
MATFVLSFIVMLLAVLAMAAGVLWFGRRPIAGSCGGLGRLGLACGTCERPCPKKRRADT